MSVTVNVTATGAAHSHLGMERSVRAESRLVAALAALVSVIAFLVFFRRGDVLLYGDAVAHINIARRIFDSRDPGLSQLGTVWLPLPHLLQLPFVVNDWMWRTGLGASIPSMIAFVLGTVGIFRIVRARATFWSALFGAAVYALNPSLLYMQSTAMTESIFLCAMIWSIVYLDEYKRALFEPHYGYGLPASLPASTALERLGLSLAAGILCRYDGWLLACTVAIFVISLSVRWYARRPSALEVRRVGRSMAAFLLLLALTPALWLAHNYYLSRKPLDWFNGPYSAKAIEQRTTRPGDPPYPGKHSMEVASEYFLKSARMTMAENRADLWIIAAVLFGTLVALSHCGQFGPLLLLWFPLPFYAYSVAYGSVPIFVPTWWPFSYYNTRYGLELLPCFAVFLALAAWSLGGIRIKRFGPIASAALVILVAAGYASSWVGDSSFERGVKSPRRGPICFREAVVNSHSRLSLENWIASRLRDLPPNAKVMMYTSQYIGALQRANLHLDRVVNESTFIFWDAAQSAPAAVADYAVAIDNDAVAKAVKVNPRGLKKIEEYRTNDVSATIYRSARLR